mmetsp:Transcript_72416/g.188891  ORF Transcript_72416/g.188891 Transcript_72416/m.188891 type:complete len:232 (-) Transcript_72416:758-1453(-)
MAKLVEVRRGKYSPARLPPMSSRAALTTRSTSTRWPVVIAPGDPSPARRRHVVTSPQAPPAFGGVTPLTHVPTEGFHAQGAAGSAVGCADGSKAAWRATAAAPCGASRAVAFGATASQVPTDGVSDQGAPCSAAAELGGDCGAAVATAADGPDAADAAAKGACGRLAPAPGNSKGTTGLIGPGAFLLLTSHVPTDGGVPTSAAAAAIPSGEGVGAASGVAAFGLVAREKAA